MTIPRIVGRTGKGATQTVGHPAPDLAVRDVLEALAVALATGAADGDPGPVLERGRLEVAALTAHQELHGGVTPSTGVGRPQTPVSAPPAGAPVFASDPSSRVCIIVIEWTSSPTRTGHYEGINREFRSDRFADSRRR